MTIEKLVERMDRKIDKLQECYMAANISIVELKKDVNNGLSDHIKRMVKNIEDSRNITKEINEELKRHKEVQQEKDKTLKDDVDKLQKGLNEMAAAMKKDVGKRPRMLGRITFAGITAIIATLASNLPNVINTIDNLIAGMIK